MTTDTDTRQWFRVSVSYGDDIVRTYAVRADDNEQAEKVALEMANDMIGTQAHDDFWDPEWQGFDYDAELEQEG